MMLKSGKVVRNSADIAYHSQQAWVLNATVKENILLGREFDEELFEKALDAACLAADIGNTYINFTYFTVLCY